MRIAFVTTEYPIDGNRAGGLASYVQRMARLLRDAGHDVEVFLPVDTPPASETVEGIRVHRVEEAPPSDLIDVALGVGGRLLSSRRLRLLRLWRRRSRAIGRALGERERAAPFDLVQSADYTAIGLHVPRRADRPHVVRCSSAADLYGAADAGRDLSADVRGMVERRHLRRADRVYAPSRLIADHLARVHGIRAEVIRPPLAPPADSQPPDFALPKRYLVHFGQISRRKGSVTLAEALPIAWERVPDLAMIWAGPVWDPELMPQFESLWGARAAQVRHVGAVPRAQLASVVAQADAAILPSLVDNLPNTVIESLALGTPVVGTTGSSIDEIVEHGVTGLLVPPGDTAALADALVAAWTGEGMPARGFTCDSGAMREMRPGEAVAAFLALATR